MNTNSMLDDIYTTKTAAEYLGISVIAIKKSKALQGFLITGRLRVYSREELDFYKAQGVGRGRINHVPFVYDPAYLERFFAEVYNRERAAAYLGMNVFSLRKNKRLSQVAHYIDDNAPLWLKRDLDNYLTNPPTQLQPDSYWGQLRKR